MVQLLFFFYIILNKIKFKYIEITWMEEDQISNLKVMKQIFALASLLINLKVKGNNFFGTLPNDINKYDYLEKSLS